MAALAQCGKKPYYNRMQETPYNPLDKVSLGQSVAKAMLDRPLQTLPPESPFLGAGIYALYYHGDFSPYEPLVIQRSGDMYEIPIYVGKAVPAGARKGGFGLGESPGTVLYKRLADHARSIDQAENLLLSDFKCRYLVVDDIWIPLGERLLIEMFSPLWNKVVDGFGNHDPGKGRRDQQLSAWDALHPGRSWTLKHRATDKSVQEIRVIVDRALRLGVDE